MTSCPTADLQGSGPLKPAVDWQEIPQYDLALLDPGRPLASQSGSLPPSLPHLVSRSQLAPSPVRLVPPQHALAGAATILILIPSTNHGRYRSGGQRSATRLSATAGQSKRVSHSSPTQGVSTPASSNLRPLWRFVSSTSQALPSRDAKAAQDPAAVLEEQCSAFFHVLAEERHAAE